MNTTVQEIKEQLRSGIISFYYTKKDGSRREATGTTSMEEIQKMDGYEPQGIRSSNDNVINYFDVDRGDWRSFRTDIGEFGLL